MIKQKGSKQEFSQEEKEFFEEFDEQVKETAKFLVDRLQEKADRGELRDDYGKKITIVTEDVCGYVSGVLNSLNEGEVEEWYCLGSAVIDIGDGGREMALIEKLKNAPFIKEKEEKALTRLKRKYRLLKLAKGVVKVLGITLVAGLTAGGIFGAFLGAPFAGKALSTAAGWSAASWGAFSACVALGLGTAIATPLAGVDLGEKVAGALDDKERKIGFDVTNMEEGDMMSLDAVPREHDIDKRYPSIKNNRPAHVGDLEKGRIMFYYKYVEAKVYMAMRDICRERALQADNQEA